MEPWYKSLLARVAAAITVLVVAANLLAYRQAHPQTDPVVARTLPTASGSTLPAPGRPTNPNARVTADVASARAVQTEAAVAVSTLEARAANTALAGARLEKTARAAQHRAVEGSRRAILIAQARATATALNRWQTFGPFAGSFELLDTFNHIQVTTSAPQTSAAGPAGSTPYGSMYLWFVVSERNDGSSRFRSSPSHFSIVSSTGTRYTNAALASPPGSRTQLAFRSVLLRRHASLGGFVRFQIPSSPYTYTLLWHEPGAIPHAVCQIQVGSGGNVALTP